MKKKTKKKLELSRETLRVLGVNVRQAVGGDNTDSCNSCTCNCDYTVECTRVDYSVEFTCACTTTADAVQPQTRNC